MRPMGSAEAAAVIVGVCPGCGRCFGRSSRGRKEGGWGRKGGGRNQATDGTEDAGTGVVKRSQTSGEGMYRRDDSSVAGAVSQSADRVGVEG
ncbi:MAG: hypothetical protein BLM47_14345, partial [Candidatus Reconcilbacillus cellulovorans]